MSIKCWRSGLLGVWFVLSMAWNAAGCTEDGFTHEPKTKVKTEVQTSEAGSPESQEKTEFRTVTGTVINPQGKPAKGVIVAAIPMTDTYVYTNSQGKYIVNWSPEWEPEKYLKILSIDRKHKLAAIKDYSLQDNIVDIILKPAIDLHGQIKDAYGKPIVGVTVEVALGNETALVDKNGGWGYCRAPFYSSPAVTNAEGYFVINSLPANQYYFLSVRAIGYKLKPLETANSNQCQTNPYINEMVSITSEHTQADYNVPTIILEKVSGPEEKPAADHSGCSEESQNSPTSQGGVPQSGEGVLISSPQPSADSQRKLLLEKRGICEKELQTMQQIYAAGRASSMELLQAKKDLLQVEYELAQTPQERINILQQIVTLCQEAEKDSKLLSEAGRINENELNKVKLQRLEAESKLAQEKNAADPNSQLEIVNSQLPFTASLPNGVTVELCTVSNYPQNSKAWQPDGSDLQTPPLFIKPTTNDSHQENRDSHLLISIGRNNRPLSLIPKSRFWFHVYMEIQLVRIRV